MAIILIDTKYIGQALKSARRENSLNSAAVAASLNISVSDLRRYERGKTIIPTDILVRLFRHALYLQTRKR